MALINTLRKRMGKIVVAVVAFSMFAFILTDLLQSNSMLFNGSNEIGDIAGTSITYQDFQAKIDQLAQNYAMTTGQNPSSDELELLRQQAWQSYITENVLDPEFKKLGITVSNDEIVDMVQGQNIHPQILQYFSDPNTGVFNKQDVKMFLQQMKAAPQQQQASWYAFESSLAPSRMLAKYENLLEFTKFANKYEAKAEYEKTATHTIDYLYVPFLTMPDSLVTVADSELKSYLNEHDAEYQREATRDLSYVVFDVVPSAQDSAAVREEIRLLAEELKNAENDSLFASINTDGIAPFGTYKPNNFPSWLIDSNTELTEGFVSTPVLDGNTYTVYRISKISEGDEAFVKASHILFKADDESDAAKNAAKAEARRVLNEIKAGADFAEMAAQYGTDGTASRGGDLGWFGENSQFVEEFKEAAFAFRGTGLLSDVVETEFGYHIIKITEAKTSRELKIAVIEKELFVSDETQNEAYRQAELFSQAATDVASFGEQALENTYVVKSANRLGKNDKRLGTIQNGRSVIYWLYNKADVGEVSDVFELENQYVVAVMTGEQEKGTARLEDVRNEISRKVIDQKKASQIMAKLASTSGSYEDRAAAYGTGARAGSSEVNLGSNSITGVGLAPVAVGVACSLDEGESTAAFEVQNGVMMITLRTKAALEELSDYEAYRGVVTNRYASYRRREEPLTFQNIYNALIEKADIEDNRYKFY